MYILSVKIMVMPVLASVESPQNFEFSPKVIIIQTVKYSHIFLFLEHHAATKHPRLMQVPASHVFTG